MCEITVFTPTYNRGNLLKRVYDSLVRQNYKDFEWLVIDDGSVDNTENLIRQYIKEKKINIKYWKKSNGGKHTAINYAIDKAEGKIFFTVDSDDYLSDDALEKIIKWFHTIENKEGFAGVSGLRCFPNGKKIGGEWKYNQNYIDATNLERERLSLTGDKAEAYYTKILRQYYPIPVFENEKCVMEAVLWNRIAAAGYKIRWFNDAICVCQYLNDGMTANSKQIYVDNFKGFTCWKKELIDMQKSYYKVIAQTAAYTEIAKKKGLKISEMSTALQRKRITILFAKIYLIAHNIKMKLK